MLSEIPEFTGPHVDRLLEDLSNISSRDAFLSLAALFLCAWARVARSDSVHLDSHFLQEVDQNLRWFLAVRFGVEAGRSAEGADSLVRSLSRRVQCLIETWDQNLNDEPSPQWHVAEDVWFMLEPDRAKSDPVRIRVLSEQLSSYIMTLTEHLHDIERRMEADR